MENIFNGKKPMKNQHGVVPEHDHHSHVTQKNAYNIGSLKKFDGCQERRVKLTDENGI